MSAQPVADDSKDAVRSLARWSDWVPFTSALETAPREPGVYLARVRTTDEVIYVGMAGLRDRGGKTAPKGIRGRLGYYASGKALTSGLGEAVLSRALADPAWVRARLVELEGGNAGTVRDWGRYAFDRADLEVCWATTADRASAVALEKEVIAALTAGGKLWNQRV
jgi:hypothetical protein